MSEIETGGPAFPVVGHFYDGKLGGQLSHGLTLRDYFAAKAMEGLQSNPIEEVCGMGYEEIASYAYNQADAMLKARTK